MQAIVTEYLGPTNHRGARIVAKCAAGRTVVPYEHALSGEAVHRVAVDALRAKLGWTGEHYPGRWVAGELPSGSGYAYVYVPTAPEVYDALHR